MSLSLILGALWAIAATIVAMLPMRAQFVPGGALLLSAPALLIFIGVQHGLWVTLLGLLAFASMFRNPLIYLARRGLGLPARLPRELERRKP
ncbi:MAG: DUF2484 family protein [Paracoccaceae bacterium]